MKANQSKSFQSAHKRSFQSDLFTDYSHMRRTEMTYTDSDITLEAIAGHIIWGLSKLFVAIKFLIFTLVWKPLQSLHLPWFKIGFFSLVAFVIFKKDFSFSAQPDQKRLVAAKNEEQKFSTGETWFGRMLGAGSDNRKIDLDSNSENNPFIALPSDDAADKKAKSYIRRFAKIAVTEMHKFGIPASVKMAQGLLESRNGESALSTKNNNHFGIKCFSKKCKKGHCSNFGDDHHKDFFRKYDNAWASWRAHSQMLATGRYKKLIEQGDDYEDWAKGLKKLGYATDKNYDEKLIQTIEKYQLYLLDNL